MSKIAKREEKRRCTNMANVYSYCINLGYLGEIQEI